MNLPLLPLWIADLVGSSLMIFFSFLCVRQALRLRNQDRSNVVWTYMLWLSCGLAGFAISRSVGHIVKRLLLTTGYLDLWETLKPYSGAINTLAFVVVASVTLFFERIWKVYQQILRDKQALQETHEQLIYLNRNLENLVAERAQELAVSERKYRRIFEVSRDMILVADRGGKIVDINPAGLEMLGNTHTVDPASHARFQDCFRNGDQWTSIEQALLSQGFVSDTEVQLKRRDESSFSALISGTAERQGDGEVNSIHFLVKDISQRKAMENQLLQADKLASIGQLAAGIAHEINNPLSMILGYTQLILRNENLESQMHSDLKIIEKHTRTRKTIVGDLLSFARSHRTRKGVAHIHTAMEEILSVLKHHVRLDGIEIEQDLDDRLPEMVLDEEKFKQVFMNLIMNAKQAIGKKGTIRLKTRYDEPRSCVVVEVSDTGCGIKPEHLSRIFDPFFTTKGTGEGTGLGLSVSYGIVKDHGGEIHVESRLEKGSTFSLILPVNQEATGKEQ